MRQGKQRFAVQPGQGHRVEQRGRPGAAALLGVAAEAGLTSAASAESLTARWGGLVGRASGHFAGLHVAAQVVVNLFVPQQGAARRWPTSTWALALFSDSMNWVASDV